MKVKVQFGDSMFEIKDVWPSRDQTPVRQVVAGVDEGEYYLSFPLSEDQKRFLGNSSATYFRVQVKKLS